MTTNNSSQYLFAAVSLERRIVELTVLYEVSQALQKTLDEEKALYTILVGLTAGGGLGFNRAFILLTDPAMQFLEGRLAIGPASPEEASAIWRKLQGRDETLGDLLHSIEINGIKKDTLVNEIAARFRIPLADPGNSLVAIMSSHEAGIALSGVFKPHGLPVERQWVEILGTENFAVAPLYLADRELGLLIADNAITRVPVETTNLKLLQIYAQEASAAIQNTRLYRELNEKIYQCETSNTALRDNQYHLLQAERLTTMGKMAAFLAHEIRNPLVSIGGFARRLVRATPRSDPRREEMEIIVGEVSRLEKLVEEVLGYSRISRPEYENADISGLLRSTVAAMQGGMEKSDIRIFLEFEKSLSPVPVDRSQLQQAIMNLVLNAVDAMPSGGTLTLSTRRDGDYVEISVADTGLGIAREHWGKLFTPFYTTKVTGTGLGLAIVSQVVENHGGAVRFDSEAGRGTTFHIRLPLIPPSLSAAADPPGVACTHEVPQ
jgi:signal transduction histidine kinase